MVGKVLFEDLVENYFLTKTARRGGNMETWEILVQDMYVKQFDKEAKQVSIKEQNLIREF